MSSKNIRTVVVIVASLMASAAIAADPPTAAEQEAERLKQEAAVLTARAGLATAEAALEKAKIEALGLSKFENKTTIESGGGAIEATMLTSRAVREAAARIGQVSWDKDTKTCPTEVSGHFLLLTATEKYDVNVPVAISIQINGIAQMLVAAIGKDDPNVATILAGGASDASMLSATALIGFVNAAASLLANETKVSGIEINSINDASLIMATAPKMCGVGVVPSASMGAIELAKSQTLQKLGILLSLRGFAANELQEIPENATGKLKARAAALTSAIATYDAFIGKISTVGADGQSPLSQALLIERFPAASTKIVRISLNKAGGSLINSKNLWTTLGVDPVKVTGGLVVTYTITEAATGLITKGETFSCQTTLTSLRKIHDDTWRPKGESTSLAICR